MYGMDADSELGHSVTDTTSSSPLRTRPFHWTDFQRIPCSIHRSSSPHDLSLAICASGAACICLVATQLKINEHDL